MSSIYSIGQSALNNAQVGLTTTGHNIANAATPGYSRQVVQQGTNIPQGFGFGFLGQGASIDSVKRVYNEFVSGQINATQSSKSALDSYYSQISQIDNVLADPDAGLSPALQDFFASVQNLTTYPDASAARQSMLSEAQALAARFRSLGQQVQGNRDGINSQIASSVGAINSYAEQIASLNDAIAKSLSMGGGNPPNDLLDQRDQLLVDLSKEVKTVTVKQDGTSLNVFIGNGQALVVGSQRFSLKAVASPSDPQDLVVGYGSTGGATTLLGDGALSGGKLGGLLEYRSQTLDAVQNAIGRTALTFALAFNAQHREGVDLDGNAGGNFFTIDSPAVIPFQGNPSAALFSASIDPARLSALTASNYRLEYDGSQYQVTRLSDGSSRSIPGGDPIEMDGIQFALASGTPQAGDRFLIKPMANVAVSMTVAIGNTNAIAAAAVGPPLRSANGSGNRGTGSISSPVADPTYASAPLTAPVTMTYADTLPPSLTGFPAGATVRVTDGSGSNDYLPGQTVPYVDGATYSFGGISFALSGAPAASDSFVVSPNNSDGDNRNALLLASLQTKKILNNGTADFQNSYSQLVSAVGNKTREVDVNRAATGRELTAAVARQQSESGVNLDEEAANLLRYQQAYQAAGKLMQTASRLFDVILELGR